MATSFESILDKQFTGYEAPKEMPQGTYLCLVKGLPEHKTSKNMNKYLQYKLQPLDVVRDDEGDPKDVDADALEEFGDIKSRTLFADFYYETEFGYSRLTSFLQACDVEQGITTREASEQANGCQVLVNIRHEPNQRGDGIQARVGDFAAVE